jgi:hypothetical protein
MTAKTSSDIGKELQNLPDLWYKYIDEKKRNRVDKKLRKDWNMKWDECSQTLKSMIYYAERKQ